MKLKTLTDIRVNFEDADFWLQRKGSDSIIGKPSHTFNKENIGIKVTNFDKVVPEFLYYLMEYVFNSGYWRKYANGTLDLKTGGNSPLVRWTWKTSEGRMLKT